jgi:PAS domain S-box-containing protein
MHFSEVSILQEESIIGSLSEMTLLQEAEEALRISEERFHRIFDNVLVGLYRTTPDGEILMANPALCRMLGYASFEEMRELNLETMDRFHPDYPRNRFKQLLEDSGELVGMESIWRRKDGSEIVVRENAKAVTNGSGKVLYYEGVAEDITERKRSEDALRMSEERLRLATQSGRMYAFEWNPETDVVIRSADLEVLGSSHDQNDTGVDFITKVHPEDRKRYQRIACGVTRSSPSYQLEYRVIRPGGKVAWLEERGRAFYDKRGKMKRMVGITADITHRVETEQAFKELSGRLLAVQEEERRRIARELHDNIGQEIVLLGLLTKKVFQKRGDDKEFSEAMRELEQRSISISRQVRTLSHQLHSAELEFLGLTIAVEAFCRDFSATHDMKIHCRCSNIPRTLERDLALCFYRVTQESLRNVLKHSGAREAFVHLETRKSELILTVRDKGTGFDTGGAPDRPGLGLVSMRERMHLVGGELKIESSPRKGTTVEARALLKTKPRLPI